MVTNWNVPPQQDDEKEKKRGNREIQSEQTRLVVGLLSFANGMEGPGEYITGCEDGS